MHEDNWNATGTNNRNKQMKQIHATCTSELQCNLPFSFTLTHSNQTLSQRVFDEVVRALSRHHLTPTNKRKIDPEREVVEADVMWKAVVVATQVCSSHENASSSAWAKRWCEAVHREKCLQCHPEFKDIKTSSILEKWTEGRQAVLPLWNSSFSRILV